MAESKHTPGPWQHLSGNVYAPSLGDQNRTTELIASAFASRGASKEDNARLIAATPEMLEVLHEGRRAIGDHFVPDHCYATGPLTGDSYRDLVQCPACSFIGMYEAVMAKLEVK